MILCPLKGVAPLVINNHSVAAGDARRKQGDSNEAYRLIRTSCNVLTIRQKGLYASRTLYILSNEVGL